MSLCAATRHDWRFAAFIHFCRLFADALHLITFSADRLEAAIVEPAEHPVFLTQLLTSLLNAKAEWQHALWYKLRRQWREHLHFLYTGNPLESKTFFELSPSERVRCLFDFQMIPRQKCCQLLAQHNHVWCGADRLLRCICVCQ